MLRQPSHVSKDEKHAFVDEVIKMLSMEDFADAVVGVPGEGLNAEQRKLLTIGVELAAKPKLILFLDEPTSGLDSQSAWAIVSFLRKLADAGQAVLCTIHQPNAVAFQLFDRLLFLTKGGKPVYFGDIGPNSRSLLDYFELNGARVCDDHENPAEYMVEVVNGEDANRPGEDWHLIWKASPQRRAVDAELAHDVGPNHQNQRADHLDSIGKAMFATSHATQLRMVVYRTFQQYWRLPTYIQSKWGLCIFGGLFIGFSFYQTDATLSGMSSVIWSVFMIATLFSPLVQQVHGIVNPEQIAGLLTNRLDPTPIRNTAVALRSARAALQNLFMAVLPDIQHIG